MGKVNQSRVKSGFDAEALLGEGYLKMALQTAYDAGLVPDRLEFETTTISLSTCSGDLRLYQGNDFENGDARIEDNDSFNTVILFGHPGGANLKVRLGVSTTEFPIAIEFHLFLAVGLAKERDADGAISKIGLAIHVVDVESPALGLIETEYGFSKEKILTTLQLEVDRTVDIGGAAKFKRVEDIQIKWLEGDADHAPALGIYINVLIRDGDEADAFLDPRGDLDEALNFLPIGEDIAMATRPGMYSQMAKDVFSRTAIPNGFGGFEHAFRKSLLNPKSKRLGDMHSCSVRQSVNPAQPFPLPANGLTIVIKGDFRDPIDLTNTDLTYTIDIRPTINSDGFLDWDTDFDCDVDATFEFITLWGATLMFIIFGPIGAGIFVGATFLIGLGVGLGISLYKQDKVASKADATLSDVILDRLTIKTRRWDPFYATLHQVVTKPSQAEFNSAGFMLCGKAFVGRELVPPVESVVRDEFRNEAGEITHLRYRVPDFEKVAEDSKLFAAGTSRRSFTPADPLEPDLWAVTLEEFEARLNDPEGKLIPFSIPYYPAAVHLEDGAIAQIMVVSMKEVEELQDFLRARAFDAGFARILALEGDQIRQDVTDDLSAGGNVPTQEEIDAEVNRIIAERVQKIIDEEYVEPTPLDLALSESLLEIAKLDASPVELIDLQIRKVIVIDPGIEDVNPEDRPTYLRDIRFGEDEFGGDDNLLSRPRYQPVEQEPVPR